jgi:hypothetical protein
VTNRKNTSRTVMIDDILRFTLLYFRVHFSNFFCISKSIIKCKIKWSYILTKKNIISAVRVYDKCSLYIIIFYTQELDCTTTCTHTYYLVWCDFTHNLRHSINTQQKSKENIIHFLPVG